MRLFALAAAAFVLAGGCPKHDAPPVKRLVLAITAEPDALSPLLAESAAAQEVTALVARDLVVEGSDGVVRPDLAESVPSLQNGGARVNDGELVVTWRIRADARWEDGAPVVAEDFVLGWRVQCDPTQAVLGHDDALRIESMVASPDGRAFTVTWKEPTPFFAIPRVHRALPSHVVEKRLVDQSGRLRPLKDDPIVRQPLSNGAFRLAAWKPGEFLRFVKNDAATPKAKLDEVLVRVMPSTTGILTAMRAGAVDAAFPSAGPSPLEARVFARENAGFDVERAEGFVWAHLDFNLDDPALKDVRVRRAIAMAIPRAQIVDGVSNGFYQLADGYIPYRHWAYAPPVDAHALDFDPAKAKELLADAHVKLPLTLKLSAAAGQPEAERMLLLVRGALEQVGVDVDLDLKPFKVFFPEIARKRKTQLAFYAWTVDDSVIGANLWRSDRIPSADNEWRGGNFAGWRDDEVTKALDDAEHTLDFDKSRALVAQVEQKFRAELPAIPFYFRPVVALHAHNVTGLHPTGTTTPLAWNAAEWDVVTPRPAATDR